MHCFTRCHILVLSILVALASGRLLIPVSRLKHHPETKVSIKSDIKPRIKGRYRRPFLVFTDTALIAFLRDW
jgi:di/tricarboxylate transporter